jgi:hypothetical protein
VFAPPDLQRQQGAAVQQVEQFGVNSVNPASPSFER